MPVIIDGNNLLWSIQKVEQDGRSISDVHLCRIVSRYLKLIGESGQIVFDGIGPSDKTQFDNISDLEVFFAGRNTDADTIIEDKIRANTAPRRLMVVSSDRKLRRIARTREAISVKAEDFWSKLCRQLSRKKTIREPREKRTGITEGETEQWLKLFGLE